MKYVINKMLFGLCLFGSPIFVLFWNFWYQMNLLIVSMIDIKLCLFAKVLWRNVIKPTNYVCTFGIHNFPPQGQIGSTENDLFLQNHSPEKADKLLFQRRGHICVKQIFKNQMISDEMVILTTTVLWWLMVRWWF